MGGGDSYPVEEVVPSHCSHVVAVIQQGKVALRRPVKLPDLDVPEPADELPPDLGSDAVAYRHPDLVDVLVGFLSQERTRVVFKLIVSI